MGTGGWEVLEQHVWTLATSFHSWGHFLPRSGAPCSCGLFPLHHIQVALTHHPHVRPQTGFATSHCPAIKEKSQLILGPRLPRAVKAKSALSFLAFLLPDEFSIFSPSEQRVGISSLDKEKSNCSFLLPTRAPNQTNFFFFFKMYPLMRERERERVNKRERVRGGRRRGRERRGSQAPKQTPPERGAWHWADPMTPEITS